MSELSQEKDRVYIGAQVDRGQRDELVRLARRRDRSVSSIIRRALAAELERTSDVGATAAAAPHNPRTERRAPGSPAVEAQALAGEPTR
jgi:hypothetical protein